jgi:hypothetical protein
MSSAVGPLTNGGEVSDDGAIADDELSRRAGIDGALTHAVYTGVQMLEMHPKTATLCHFLDRPARLRRGTARSARRCSIMGSDMTRARPARPRTELQWVHRDCNIDFR